MHLLFTHLPGDVLRDTLYGTLPEFRKQLVACRLVGDGDARAEILPQIGGNLLDGVCFHGSRNEDAFLSVIVIHGKFHGDDGTAIFHLKDNGSDTCNLFEGFIDCLSWLELGLGYGDDYLVLNSVSLLERSFPILDRYERVNCYLDRDEAGRRTLEALRKRYADKLVDCSSLYKGYKDLNEYLQHKFL